MDKIGQTFYESLTKIESDLSSSVEIVIKIVDDEKRLTDLNNGQSNVTKAHPEQELPEDNEARRLEENLRSRSRSQG